MSAEPIYESMTQTSLYGLTIRVWGKANGLEGAGPRADVLNAIKGLPYHGTTLQQVAEVLDRLPLVAAYEIKDSWGCGVVVYKEWP